MRNITIDNSVNVNLSNLTPIGKNFADWSTNVSNCVTKIPQDIKLELSDGTLTLKKGSIIQLPDGTTKECESDLTFTSTTNGKSLLYAAYNVSFLGSRLISKCVSGETRSLIDTYMLWYDTANGIVYNYGSNPSSGSKVSLPIAEITVSNGVISSIDKIFNGFGYIGSSIFALPGLEFIIPDGRNTDGSLKNIKVKYSELKVSTQESLVDSDRYLVLKENSIDSYQINSLRYYDEKENYVKIDGSNVSYAFAGYLKFTSGSISGFDLKNVFHALDFGDKNTISKWSLPSNLSLDISLGSSGNTYTAPANGWYCLGKIAGASGAYIEMINTSSSDLSVQEHSNSNTSQLTAYIPAKKGDIIKINYAATGTTNFFKFIYSEGEI